MSFVTSSRRDVCIPILHKTGIDIKSDPIQLTTTGTLLCAPVLATTFHGMAILECVQALVSLIYIAYVKIHDRALGRLCALSLHGPNNLFLVVRT